MIPVLLVGLIVVTILAVLFFQSAWRWRKMYKAQVEENNRKEKWFDGFNEIVNHGQTLLLEAHKLNKETADECFQRIEDYHNRLIGKK